MLTLFNFGTERYLLDMRLPKEFVHPPASSSTQSPIHSRPWTPVQDSQTSSLVDLSQANKSIDLKHGKGQEEWVTYSSLDPDDLLTGGKGMCLLPNDWPYNIPYGATHSLIWTRVGCSSPDKLGY
jgi:hypothetical protein